MHSSWPMWVLLCSLLWQAHSARFEKSALDAKAALTELKDLSGAWVLKRTFAKDRYFDVMKASDTTYEVFPISGCLESSESAWGFRSSLRCDDKLHLSIKQEPSKADDTSGFYVESSEVKQWNGKEVKVVHAGDSRANGEYKISGYHGGRPEYTHITNDRMMMHWSSKTLSWRLYSNNKRWGRDTLYYSKQNTFLLPEGQWQLAEAGNGTAPLVVIGESSLAAATRSRFLVAGAGDARINGEFWVAGFNNDRPEYVCKNCRGKVIIHWSKRLQAWRLLVDNILGFRRKTLYISKVDQFILPTSGWELVAGSAPLPEVTGAGVHKEELEAGGIFANTKTAEPDFTREVTRLAWSDGSVWVRHSTVASDLENWDNECRELNGASESATSLQYGLGMSVVANFAYTNIPGIVVEFVQCLSSQWLSLHQDQFHCILDKATGNSSLSQSAVVTALHKVQRLLPGPSSTCAPEVCLALGFPVFPFPSPIPGVALISHWPFNTNNCNGMTLQSELGKAEQNLTQAVESEAERKPPGFMFRHGVHMNLFPIPAIGYFFNGAKPLGAMSFLGGKTPDFSEVDASRAMVQKQLDAQLERAMEECPNIRRRFELHYRNREVQERLLESPGQRSRIVASSFPELAGRGTIRRQLKAKFAVGAFGVIGTGGLTVGLFGNVAFQGKSLAKLYKGCPAWREVVDLWDNNPVLEVEPQDEVSISSMSTTSMEL